jgi:hypothetical protein
MLFIVGLLAMLTLAPRFVDDLGGYFTGGSISAAAPVAPEAELSETPVTPFHLLFPVFNQDGVDALLSDVAPKIEPGDTVIVVTGNNDNELDTAWLRESVKRIHAALPGVKVYAMTSGLDHVRRIRYSGITGIDGIVYDYENNFPNEPEFSYDFETTKANAAEFSNIMQGSGMKSVLLPTGLPLARDWAQKYGWDYATLGSHVDMQIIQTQTYCKSSVSEFDSAISRAVSQYSSRGTGMWMPQVTSDMSSPNGVPPQAAAECLQTAVDAGHNSIMVWWSPYRTSEVLQFLDLVGR